MSPPPGRPGRPAPPSARLARAASLVLLVGAVASLALLGVLVYQLGGSTAGWALASYAGLVTASAALAWGAVGLPPVARVSLASVGVFAVLLAYGAEATLGLLPRARRVQGLRRLAERTGTPQDERSLPAIVGALRGSGVPAVPAVVPSIILRQWGPAADPRTRWTSPLFPLAGVSRRPTVLCNEDGQYRTYDSDEHGFANPVSSWSRPGHDVVLIGDSFTHGSCVSADSTYAAGIRRRWPASLNLGTGGSGPLLELATLLEYAAPFRPRVVVWQYFINDISDLALERRNPLLLRYLTPGFSQGLRARQAEIDAEIEAWVGRLYAAGRGAETHSVVSWRQVLTLFRLRTLARTLLLDRAGRRAELALFRQILTTARDRVRGWGGELYVVSVPAWEEYFQPAALGGRNVHAAALAIVRELGLPLVDLEPAVRRHPDRARLFARHELVPAHFSGLGYALMATEVGNAIEKSAPAPPPLPR